MADSWEYQTISKNSVDLTMSLAKFKIGRKLADQLHDDGVIGESVRDMVYVVGPDVTEQMRIRPIIDAMREKIKLKKKRYYQFRKALLTVLGPDADAVEAYVPEGREPLEDAHPRPVDSHTGEASLSTKDDKLFDPAIVAQKTVKSEIFGGTRGGSPWDDSILNHSPVIMGVHAITIRHGDQVDSIQVTYLLADGSIYSAGRHGGFGGSSSSFKLAADERIIRIEGKTNHALVDQVTFITRKANGTENKYGPYGKTGRTPFSIDGYVLGFYGRAGNLLDGLGVYYIPEATYSMMPGGKQTLPF